MTANPGSCQPHFSEALFTDLYELTMAEAYLALGMDQPAVFELFFRRLPASRNFAIAAGLADALDYLERMKFDADDLDYLRSKGLCSDALLDRLRTFRFAGDVYAVPEGTPVFPNEPVLQVVAPLLEAQLVETYLMNQIHFQSLIATKAARVVHAAAGRTVVDFGSRRAHGTDAALKVARASYLAGVSGTSNVLAGKHYGIPVFGTMAHSYVQAHADELAAFQHFAEIHPNTTLLVDTYDTLQGVRNVIALAKRLGDHLNVSAIRLDSGDLAELSIEARRMLDDAGLKHLTIFASSGLDEFEIRQLLDRGAPIDGFGVGAKLAISSDSPELDFAYKLVEYAGEPRTKLSAGKFIYPRQKQVFRQTDDHILTSDTIGLHDERLPGYPLLQPVMKQGRRLQEPLSLDRIRSYTAQQLNLLPASLLRLDPAGEPYRVDISPTLQAQADAVHASHSVAMRSR